MQVLRVPSADVQLGDRVIGFMHRPVGRIILRGFQWHLLDEAGAPIIRTSCAATLVIARGKHA